MKRAGQVGRQHRLPILLLHAHGQAVLGDAGVVHQNVDAAEFLALLCEKAERMESADAQIHLHDERLAARGANFGGDLLELIDLARGQHDARAADDSASAQARPMPRLAPVTNAIRFCMIYMLRSAIIIELSRWLTAICATSFAHWKRSAS